MYLVQKPYLSVTGFHIYNASAGSGKTYQLTKTYLKHLISAPTPTTLRQMLALTFTNKAVAEMKERILNNLYVFGNPEEDKAKNPMFHEIKTELGLNSETMVQRSALGLRTLLHNYTFFSISTIDKFTHSIVKTFAKDLDVAQNFQVELDQDLLLDSAITLLLTQLHKSPKWTSVLIAFALEKVEEEHSWNILYDLKNIGKLLFDENHYWALQSLKDASIEDFETQKKHLATIISELETEALVKAQQALDTISRFGFKETDFIRGILPNHFKKILAGVTAPKTLYNNNLETDLIENKVTLKSVQKDTSEITAVLLDIYQQLRTLLYRKKFYQNARRNLLPLTILNEIAKQVNQLKVDKQILHLSEFNKLINKVIKDQPVPFIYERLGSRFNHFFIDEFQDTSTLQWENLIPLIANALEGESAIGQKGSLFLVGDVKQSIYRWRGGDPKLLLNLINEQNIPFSVAPKVTLLSTNYRSFETIVNFNNDFFTHVSPFLSDTQHQTLYADQSAQRPHHSEGGTVEITFLEDDHSEQRDAYCGAILQTIDRILDLGYQYEDLCVLVRNNKEGMYIADFLAQKIIPIISSDALLLNNNPKVKLLIALLRFINTPGEPVYQAEVLEYLVGNTSKKHDIISTWLGKLGTFLENRYAFNSTAMSRLTVLDILESAIRAFNIVPESDAHVIHLLDVAYEVGEKHGVGIHDFLAYWDTKKATLAIAAPQQSNAVRIMTVHKAKGLEFPFVIFPFANTKINDPIQRKKLWVPLMEDDVNKLQQVLVTKGEEMQWYSTITDTYFQEENALSELDDINILYVALTRAVRGLFILTQKPAATTRFSTLFKDFLVEKQLWSKEQVHYVFGTIPKPITPKSISEIEEVIPYSNKANPDLIVQRSFAIPSAPSNDPGFLPREKGKLIHNILAEINTAEDIESAVQKACYKGEIPKEESTNLTAIVKEIVTHPQLALYYKQGIKAFNERALMDSNGDIFRPDRLVFFNDQVVVMDYKTGASHTDHQQQLGVYAQLLEQMEYKISDKILIYINQTVQPFFF